jgi:folylpolyglutamate synthase/dihydropteroate synthase
MIFVIFAAFKDKDVDPMLKELQLVSSRITVTSFNHPGPASSRLSGFGLSIYRRL